MLAKKLILIILLFISTSYFGQTNSDSLLVFALKDKGVVLYSDYRYRVADTLERLERLYEVYLVNIDTCVPNFCRVKGYTTLPYLKDKQESNDVYWVENEDIESALHGDFSIYKEPFFITKDNLKLRISDYSDIYFKVNIIAVKNDWVKIQFNINNQSLIGWVESSSLCPLKHTSCFAN